MAFRITAVRSGALQAAGRALCKVPHLAHVEPAQGSRVGVKKLLGVLQGRCAAQALQPAPPKVHNLALQQLQLEIATVVLLRVRHVCKNYDKR